MNIILIPIYGAFGAVIATITASSIQIALNLYIGNKVCPINYGLKRILYIFAIISSIILLAYPIMFYIDNIIIKFVIKLLIIISFVLIIYFYRLLNFQEIKKEFIKNIWVKYLKTDYPSFWIYNIIYENHSIYGK